MRARAFHNWAAARQVDMPSLAHRLGARLKQSGKFWIGACPIGHASCDGFVVNPHRHLFYCRPSKEGGDAIEMVRHVQGCTKVEALAFITGNKISQRADRTSSPPDSTTESSKPCDPMKFFRHAGPLVRGCTADLYFSQPRRIDLTDIERACLRFSPALWHWPSHTKWSAVVAEVALADGTPLTSHMTFLEPDGSDKAPLGEKARLFAAGGKTATGAVWFGAPNPTEEFIVAEGIEPALSAARIFNCESSAAALSANGIRTLILPAAARRVRIFADNDKLGQGVAAARDAARRWIAEGRTVAVSMAPNVGEDANDVWLKLGRNR
jgi:Toprim domain/CHC2 zinc finger